MKRVKEFLRIAFWALKESFRLSKFSFLLLLISTIVTYSIPVLSSYFQSRVIDALISLDERMIIIAFGLTIGSEFIRRGARSIQKRSSNVLKKIVNYKFQEKSATKIASLSTEQLEEPETNDIIVRANENSDQIVVFTLTFIDFFATFITFISLAYVAFLADYRIALILLCLRIPVTIFSLRNTKAYWKFYHGTTIDRKLFRKNIGELTYIKRAVANKITGSYTYLLDKIEKQVNSLLDQEMRIINKENWISILSNIFITIGEIIVPLVLVRRVLSKIWSIGDYTFFSAGLINFSTSTDTMIDSFRSFYDNTQSLNYVYKFFKLDEVSDDDKKAIPKFRVAPDISVKGVDFKYPQTKEYSLRDVNLKIKSGEKVAVVGENGAGKSTLLKLILRIYNPTSGTILVDDFDLSKCKRKDWWNNLSVHFQDFTAFFGLNVAENIAISEPEDDIDMGKVLDAARESEAEGFISKKEHGFDSMVMKVLPKGTDFSGGEWQRLVLARIFYKDATVLMLDEPTSMVDAEAEERIFNKLHNLPKDKTVIFVSHRFSTVREADRIIVVDKGQVKEVGTHDELMKLNGKYKKMFSVQAKGYQD